jgi:DinB superfamily
MRTPICLCCLLLITVSSLAQEVKVWTEADRKYLVDNLIRDRDEVIQATKGLSKKQWSFKESPDRWSINEVLEHIDRWELIFDSRIAGSLAAGKNPERMAKTQPDSTFVNFIMEEKPHYSLEYTKPFSYTIPMGMNDLDSNLAWFLKMRNELIEYVKTTNDDLRMYFNGMFATSIHQTCIYTFGHGDRHLRQIAKIKKDPKYQALK